MPIKENEKRLLDKYKNINNNRNYGRISRGLLKIIGEKKPQLSELPVVSSKNNIVSNSCVYEYLWVLSITGPDKEEEQTKSKWSDKIFYPLNKIIQRIFGFCWVDKIHNSDEAIKVQVIFNTYNSNYFVKPVTGDIKAPFMVRKCLWDSIKDLSMKITGTTVQLAGSYMGIPVVKETGSAISDLANQLKKDTAPPSHAYSWYSKMITVDDEQLPAVEWCITKRAFKNLGNYLVGGLGLLFIQSRCDKDNYIELELRSFIQFDNDKCQNPTWKNVWPLYKIKNPIKNRPPNTAWLPADPDDKPNYEIHKLVLRIEPVPKDQ
jgi:hypothetical protein